MKLALLAWTWTSFLLIPCPIFPNFLANVCLPALTSFLTRSAHLIGFPQLSYTLYTFMGPVFSLCLKDRSVLFALFSVFSSTLKSSTSFRTKFLQIFSFEFSVQVLQISEWLLHARCQVFKGETVKEFSQEGETETQA